MTDQVSEGWIAEQREARYRRTPGRRIQTIDQARAFVDEQVRRSTDRVDRGCRWYDQGLPIHGAYD